MRSQHYLSLAAAVLALGLVSPNAARASDETRVTPPAGFGHEQNVRHWVYYPRYRNFYYTYGQKDPFGYQYEPHGYYPYYNSGEWKPARSVPRNRAHFAAPEYYAGWGKNKRHWNQAEWHSAHHDRHPFWDW